MEGIDIRQLTVEEVNYELGIRGEEYDALTLQQKVELLERCKGAPCDKEVLDALDTRDEVRTLVAKVGELGILVEESTPNERSPRLPALYLHVHGRLRRIMFHDGDTYAEFASLAKKFNRTHGSVSDLYPECVFRKLVVPKEESGSDEDPLRENRRKNERRHRDGRRRGEEGYQEEGRRERRQYRSPPRYKSESSASSSSESDRGSRRSKGGKVRRTNLVTRWNFRFSNEEDLDAFLDDVEEAAQTHEVGDDELLRGIGSLLTGSAKTWFRAKKSKITSWRNFKKSLKEAFRPDDNDEEVMEKINNIRQKSNETYAVYEARAEVLFQRLSRPLSSKDRLRKLVKGLDLYYRRNIRMTEIEALRDLRETCHSIEVDKSQVTKLEKEERRKTERKDMKEERRDVRRGARAFEAEVEEVAASSDDTTPEAAAINVSSRGFVNVQCFRCGKVGHISSACTEKISCMMCGAADTVAERCIKCRQTQENASRDKSGGSPAPWTSIPPPPLQQIIRPTAASSPQPSKGGPQPQKRTNQSNPIKK